MRYLKILLLLCCIPLGIFAQSIQQPIPFKKGFQTISNNHTRISSEAEALHFLQQHIAFIQDEAALKLISKQASQLGTHFTFQQFVQGIPVYHADIKLHVSNDGLPFSVFNNLQEPPLTLTNIKAGNQTLWFVSDASWIPVNRSYIKSPEGPYIEQLTSMSGEKLFEKILSMRDKKDSLVAVKLFKPDPLTTAQKNYGDDNGTWKNRNVSDYPEITAQRKDVSLWLRLTKDTFIMENAYVTIKDLERPNIAPFTTTNPDSLVVTRSNSAFTEEMVLAHTWHYHERLKRVGFTYCETAHHPIDAHAANGNDDSRFDYGPDGPSVYFGTGGVPDAEDADVITHEYTHAMGDIIAPNSSDGTERMGIEEGGCDFMACQYSRELSEYNWRVVFNWDGHNEYWNGRDGNIAKLYAPENVTDYYKGAEIWCSMMNDMSIVIPADSMLKLYLNFMFQYSNNMSMMDGNLMLLQTDSLLFGNRYHNGLKFCMKKRGFDIDAQVVTPDISKRMILLNSAGFAHGNGDLGVETLSGFHLVYELLDIQGNCILKGSGTHRIQIASDHIQSGNYILRLSDETGHHCAFHLVRY